MSDNKAILWTNDGKWLAVSVGQLTDPNKISVILHRSKNGARIRVFQRTDTYRVVNDGSGTQQLPVYQESAIAYTIDHNMNLE